jgi:hypothetical protein
MKTERKHELKTNDLGSFLVETNAWLKINGTKVALAGIAVVAIIIALNSAARSRTDAADIASMSLAKLSFTPEDAEASFEEMDQLIADASDRDFKMQVLLQKASVAMHLAIRTTEGFQPQYLDKAEEAYLELKNAFPDRMPAKATALLGLASIEESRFATDGDLAHKAKAEKYLTEVKNDDAAKGTPFQTVAAKRLLDLNKTFQVIALAEPLPEPPAEATSSDSVSGVSILNAPPGIELKRLDSPPPGFGGRPSEQEPETADAPEDGDTDTAPE